MRVGTSSQSFSGCFLNASDCQQEGVTWKISRLLPGLYQPDGQAIGHMCVTEIISPLAFNPSFCFVLYMLPFFFLSAVACETSLTYV